MQILCNTVVRGLDTLLFTQQEARRKPWFHVEIMLGDCSPSVILFCNSFSILVIRITCTWPHHHKIGYTKPVYQRKPISRTPGMRYISSRFYSLTTVHIHRIDGCILTRRYTRRIDRLLQKIDPKTPGAYWILIIRKILLEIPVTDFGCYSKIIIIVGYLHVVTEITVYQRSIAKQLITENMVPPYRCCGIAPIKIKEVGIT